MRACLTTVLRLPSDTSTGPNSDSASQQSWRRTPVSDRLIKLIMQILKPSTGEKHKTFIIDIIERIIFYDLQIESVLARTGDGGDAELLFIREKIGAYLAAKS